MFVVERVARNGFGERGWKGECLDNVWCIFMEADNNINLEKKKWKFNSIGRVIRSCISFWICMQENREGGYFIFK